MAKRHLSKAAERARAKRRKKRQFRAQVIGFVRDILVAMLIVVIVMSCLYAISGGIWPPMVVVESESMMHGSDSHIGTIDTGDLTLVKKISSRSDIVTYVQGRPSYNVSYDIAGVTKAETFKGSHPGFSTYSDYGEVIIYEKNGRSSETPVIHRAIVWFEPNTTPECIITLPHGYYGAGDFPDIKNAAHPNGLRCVSQLTIHKVGFTSKDLSINSNDICINAVNVATDKKPFAGFLTHGDNNYHQFPVMVTDQQSLPDGLGRTLAPVKVSWIVGKAVGELPWFGALKLVASKTRHAEDIPQSSRNGLIATIVLIFVVPFIIDLAIAQYQKRKGKKKKKKEDEDLDDEKKKEEE
jgi:signal peptidase